MSTLSVATINSANDTTDFTISSGNTSAGKVVISSSGGLQLYSNSTNIPLSLSATNSVVVTNNVVLDFQNSAYIQAIPTQIVFNYDSTDYTVYDKSSNYLNTFIGGAAVHQIFATGTNVNGNLTVTGNVVVNGYVTATRAAIDDDGTKSSGTYTPDPTSGSAYKKIINAGAFTLFPPAAPNNTATTLSLLIVNTTGAGAITTSSFTKVTGDDFTTTTTDEFLCRIEVYDVGGTEYSLLDVVALQ